MGKKIPHLNNIFFKMGGSITTEAMNKSLVVPSGSLVARVFDHVLPIVNACFCAYETSFHMVSATRAAKDPD